MTKGSKKPQRTTGTRQDALEAYRQKLRGVVAKFGWAAQSVLGDPSTTYSVGVTLKYGHPELFVVGLPPEVAQGILRNVVARIEKGEVFTPGTDYDNIVQGFPVRFAIMGSERAYIELKAAREYADDGQPKALQLLWPSADGKFPDDETASQSFRLQQPFYGLKNA